MFDDFGLLTTAPGDVAAALGEVMPLSLLALAAVERRAVGRGVRPRRVACAGARCGHGRSRRVAFSSAAWLKRFGLHLAAAIGATGIFVAAAAVGASQTRQQGAAVSAVQVARAHAQGAAQADGGSRALANARLQRGALTEPNSTRPPASSSAGQGAHAGAASSSRRAATWSG